MSRTKRQQLEWHSCAFRTVKAEAWGYTATVERYDVGARLRVRKPYLHTWNWRGEDRTSCTKPLLDIGYRSVKEAMDNALRVIEELAAKDGAAVQARLPI